MTNTPIHRNMSPLSERVNKSIRDGYDKNFEIKTKGLHCCGDDKYYSPKEVSIVNFYRFEGPSDPADNSILYIIETIDGLKGTLIDGYGVYSDTHVSDFIKDVEEIQKMEKH